MLFQFGNACIQLLACPTFVPVIKTFKTCVAVVSDLILLRKQHVAYQAFPAVFFLNVLVLLVLQANSLHENFA